MREVKFRAWNNELNTMADNENLKGALGGLILATKYHGKEFTFMQYTGLKDKNGKEIYEGDIGWDEHHECYGVVNFDEGKFVYVWGNICEDLFETSVEVIGNIYENPELLEESPC